MEMEDFTSPVFGLLVHWLYTQTIEFDDDDDDEQDKTIMLADLWTLSEVCQMTKLQNETMAMLFPRVGFTDIVGLKAF